jgi:predicted metal-binding membrane protein
MLRNMTLSLSRFTGTVPGATLVLAGSLGVLSLVSWYFVAGANMPMAGTIDPTAFVLFTAIWGVGMVAMMFPSLVPMVYAITMSAKKEQEDRQVSPTARGFPVSFRASVFILGYMGIWTLVGSGFYLAITGLVVVGVPVGLGAFGFGGGIILIATGLYQFTRFKQGALMKCRSPMSFILTSWKKGNTGAGLMGADYGFICVKCCWVLMAGLLVVGAMSLPLMGVFALIIFAEKVFPKGHLISRMIGAAFLAAGVYLLL